MAIEKRLGDTITEDELVERMKKLPLLDPSAPPSERKILVERIFLALAIPGLTKKKVSKALSKLRS